MGHHALGEIRIDPPRTGVWPLQEHPKVIHVDGVRFERSDFWVLPRPGVVAQYRECRGANAAHLHVLADGTYRIDHLDEANPDRGYVVGHFVKDTSIGKKLKPWGPAILCASLLGMGVLVHRLSAA